jgi:cyclopropane fatty-acyl-phospholipid synthase-like methyltransferase
MNPKDIVKRGFDRASFQYRGDVADERCAQYNEWFEEIEIYLPPGQTILDLGCGNGIPACLALSENYQVTGLDFSAVQISRARRLAPKAVFYCRDMVSAELPVPDGFFNAIISFYALIHLPRHDLRPTLDRISRWLAPGGLFMATIGFLEREGIEENWLNSGADMYWSHPDQTEFLRQLEQTGLSLLRTDFVPDAHRGDGHGLILARK